MEFKLANHYVLAGSGIEAVVDTSSISGDPSVSIVVDGTAIENPSYACTPEGIVIGGIVEAVPDLCTVDILVTLPEVNLSEDVVTFAGYAALTKALTTIAGPGQVPGARQLYTLRPVAGEASGVSS